MVMHPNMNVLLLQGTSILEYGNFVIGIGTFALAIVLGALGWHNSNRDRAVHIANKRQDWIRDFRLNLGELMALQTVLIMNKDSLNSNEMNITKQKFAELYSRMELMFYFKEEKTKKFLKILDKVSKNIYDVNLKTFSSNKEELRNSAREIIRIQANKISKLDSKEPLI